VATFVVGISTSGQTKCAAGRDLVSQVARIVGGESEPLIRAQALDCINRVRLRMNKRNWRFQKYTNAAITLVSGTQTYSLDSTFKSPSHVQLLNTSSEPEHTLRYVDDAWLAQNRERQTDTGRPQWYWMRNTFQDAQISLLPIPDSGAATDFTLRVENYERIAAVADSDVAVDIPEEAGDVLIAGGQYWLLSEREKNSPALAVRKADYEQLWRELISADRRMDDARQRIHLTAGARPFDEHYIKI